jgi:hypothetical protein
MYLAQGHHPLVLPVHSAATASGPSPAALLETNACATSIDAAAGDDLGGTTASVIVFATASVSSCNKFGAQLARDKSDMGTVSSAADRGELTSTERDDPDSLLLTSSFAGQRKGSFTGKTQALICESSRSSRSPSSWMIIQI